MSQSSFKEAILHTACQEGDVTIMEALLDELPDFEKYLHQDKLLFTAIRSKNITIINLLLERGSNINVVSYDGRYPIHAAAEYGDVKVFEYLLEKGAKIDQKDYDKTPFFYAVENNNGPLVEMLINKGTNVNAQDMGKRTPLHYAARRGHSELVRTLLNAGSEVDPQDNNGETPLFKAAVNNNNIAVIELLLNRGARINLKIEYGYTPLTWAIECACLKNVKYLLNAGACIDVDAIFDCAPFDVKLDSYSEDDEIKTKTVLKKHLIKHQVANISINLVTSEYISINDALKTLMFRLDAIECRSFQESCVLEVEEMKKKRFCGVSLYDVLIKTVNPTFADNIELEQFINSDSLKNIFPKYADLIKLKFKEAKMRNNLLKFNVSKIVTVTDLPSEVKREIFCYLTNEDLEILKVALQDAY